MSESFDAEEAAGYESWYETPEGKRADRLEKAALTRMLREYPDSHWVLEVGCGTGHFTRWLGHEGWSAVGLDLSAAMLARARALDGTRLVRGNAYRLPFADGTFDVVTLVTTLEFLDRPSSALRESLRVARQGVVLGVLNRCSILSASRRLRGLFQPTVYDDARFYSVGDLKRLLKSVGANGERIVWTTTLYPRWWPFSQDGGRWGAFIALALRTSNGTVE